MSARFTLTAMIVTVTEDRAHVRRTGTVDVATGLTKIRIDDVSPVIADKTLRVRATHGRVGDARVDRRIVTTTPAEAHAALAKELEEKIQSTEALQANIKRAESAITLLHEAQRRVFEELAEDAARGTIGDATTSARAVTTFDERERAAYREFLDAQKQKRDLDQDIARLRTRLQASGHEERRVVASIEFSLSSDATSSCEIVVEYIVPGACFRPQHTATLDPKTGELSITTDACVWQNTGEDWNDVALEFSTERPSLGQKPPTLFDDELFAQRRSDVIQVETRDETIQTAGLGGGGASASRVPGIDDGGEVRVLSAKGRATIPSDGRPHRVPTISSKMKSTSSLVSYPELAEAVLVKAVQTNESKSALLAGPVDLVRASGFVGRTKLPLIAAGERFELGFGPDPHVRVRREMETVNEESGLLPSNWIGRSHRIRVHLSNLDTSPRKIEVTERVPVSEIEKVEIHFDEKKTSPRMAPDENGFVKWNVELASRGRTTLELRYVVRRHKDVSGI